MALAWLCSQDALLRLEAGELPGWAVALLIALRTQLQTGLFIVSHDAMHGVLWPGRPRWNHRLGATCLWLYAALPYGACRQNHQRHHRAPASASDPDFAPEHRSSALSWYGTFMGGYLTGRQMTGLLSTWGVLLLLYGHVSRSAGLNVLLFCTLPLLLSSFQLFLFGTYLPHRVQRGRDRRPHPDSLDLPPWLSLLACFHFGYHREHHDEPQLSWWQLPRARQRSRRLTLAEARR